MVARSWDDSQEAEPNRKGRCPEWAERRPHETTKLLESFVEGDRDAA